MQYKALSNIKCNGIDYKEGETIDLSEVEAASLLESKAIAAVDLPYSEKLNTPWGANP